MKTKTSKDSITITIPGECEDCKIDVYYENVGYEDGEIILCDNCAEKRSDRIKSLIDKTIKDFKMKKIPKHLQPNWK